MKAPTCPHCKKSLAVIVDYWGLVHALGRDTAVELSMYTPTPVCYREAPDGTNYEISPEVRYKTWKMLDKGRANL